MSSATILNCTHKSHPWLPYIFGHFQHWSFFSSLVFDVLINLLGEGYSLLALMRSLHFSSSPPTSIDNCLSPYIHIILFLPTPCEIFPELKPKLLFLFYHLFIFLTFSYGYLIYIVYLLTNFYIWPLSLSRFLVLHFQSVFCFCFCFPKYLLSPPIFLFLLWL